jgi:hypothetical protein
MAEGRPQRKTQPPKLLDGFEVGSRRKKTPNKPKTLTETKGQTIEEEIQIIKEKTPIDLEKNNLHDQEDILQLSDTHPKIPHNISNKDSIATSSINHELQLPEISLSNHQDSKLTDEKTKEISFQCLLQHMISKKTTAVSLTSLSQKEPLLSFVCQKFDLVQENLPKDAIKELQAQIVRFLSSFRRLYRQKNRQIGLLLKHKWSKQLFKLPLKFFKATEETTGTAETEETEETAETEETEESDSQDWRKDFGSELTEDSENEETFIKVHRLLRRLIYRFQHVQFCNFTQM